KSGNTDAARSYAPPVRTRRSFAFFFLTTLPCTLNMSHNIVGRILKSRQEIKNTSLKIGNSNCQSKKVNKEEDEDVLK
ncbi:tigger transposable element-derived protein 6-like, partial [Aphis craccivora]